MTDQEHFENKANWANNQFITLENIIDNIVAKADDDSYVKNAKRFRMSIIGKQGIKRLNIDLKIESKAISYQIGPSKIVPVPRYMSNWNRISVLTTCNTLTTLNIGDNPQINDYLQDHNYNLLYDHNGNVLEGKCFNAQKGHCSIKIDPCGKASECPCEGEDFSESWVKYNRSAGYFEFSQDLVDRVIVIEFQTSGLDSINDCDVKIPEILELTVENWIMFNLLKGKRNIDSSKWKEYFQLYKIEKNRAGNLLSNKISLEQIKEAVSLRYNG